MGDIPSAGSGLGSSSTVTVGALHAMYHLLGEPVTAERLALEACEIEIDILHKPIGIQDQYIAAYGGLRFFEFKQDGHIMNERLQLSVDMLRILNENLLLFFTGVTRQSAEVLTEQNNNISNRRSILREMKEMAVIARNELEAGNFDSLGKMLHESWQLKKRLATKISNGTIDEAYAAALSAGAIGGKISGAGGGGFLLLYCPHERHAAVRETLKCMQELPFRLEYYGSKVIFDYSR
jgi:D-glycero-alpha-D-manno-heptose-7-phosphate kinase